MQHTVLESASPDRFRFLPGLPVVVESVASGTPQPTQKRLLCSRGSGRGVSMTRELPAAGRVVSLVAVCVEALQHHLSHWRLLLLSSLVPYDKLCLCLAKDAIETSARESAARPSWSSPSLSDSIGLW